MNTLQFIYDHQAIDFQALDNENVMVNATQMAKVFGKRIDHFLRSDHSNAFIEELLSTPYGGNKTLLTRDDIIKTNNKAGTWMHRILALKFAAWLDPKFEVWVFSTIDSILLGHYRELKEATLEKIKAQQELEDKKASLLKQHPEAAEIFEIQNRIHQADRKRYKAIKASTNQMKIDYFIPGND